MPMEVVVRLPRLKRPSVTQVLEPLLPRPVGGARLFRLLLKRPYRPKGAALAVCSRL